MTPSYHDRSGPGASPIDPNYINAGPVGPVIDFDAAGGFVRRLWCTCNAIGD